MIPLIILIAAFYYFPKFMILLFGLLFILLLLAGISRAIGDPESTKTENQIPPKEPI